MSDKQWEESMQPQRLGAIMQIAYVVDDLHDAIAKWARDLLVGPFFVYEHVKYRQLMFRGKPSAADVSLAFAFTGDLQIELVQQHNDAPSVYREFLARKGTGVQHMGALSDDLVADTVQLKALGIDAVQHGISATGSETIYFESERSLGSMLELIQTSDGLRASFARMKRAAQDWNGKNPYAPPKR
ncbi:MAG TPA: VOC family protein [Rhizomicrobium sp.]